MKESPMNNKVTIVFSLLSILIFIVYMISTGPSKDKKHNTVESAYISSDSYITYERKE